MILKHLHALKWIQKHIILIIIIIIIIIKQTLEVQITVTKLHNNKINTCTMIKVSEMTLSVRGHYNSAVGQSNLIRPSSLQGKVKYKRPRHLFEHV